MRRPFVVNQRVWIFVAGFGIRFDNHGDIYTCGNFGEFGDAFDGMGDCFDFIKLTTCNGVISHRPLNPTDGRAINKA